MKVFISWSGKNSKDVAIALRNWLPDVIQSVRPWMSEMDIQAGARWGSEIASELNDTKYGIVCLTRSNLIAPWILFETGALAKTLNDTFVCPYLIGLSHSDLPQGPLTQFQAKLANRDGTWDLVCSINNALGGNALAEPQLHRTFDKWWPELEKVLQGLPQDEPGSVPIRPLEDTMEEVLELVRGISRKLLSDDTNSYVLELFSKVNTWPTKQLSEKEQQALKKYINTLKKYDFNSAIKDTDDESDS